MKAYVLHLGTLSFAANSLVAAAVPEAENHMVDIPIWSVLVKHEQGNVVFDLGCRPDGMEEGVWSDIVKEQSPHRYEPDQTMEAQLAKAGLAPTDVDTVVVSHMHNDHFGNIKLFGHADVYVPKEDWVCGLIDTHSAPTNIGYYDTELFEFRVKQYHPIAVGEDFELLPGIEIITLPGHTDNLLGMVLHLDEDGTLIFPSDALYTPMNFGPPARPSGVVIKPKEYLESIEKIRSIQSRYDAKIMFSHYYPLFNTFRKAPEYYA